MFDKFIKYIVYILSFLIIAAFFAVIYGTYTKINSKSSINNTLENLDEVISLSLSKGYEIKNIEVIDNYRVLINVIYEGERQGIIFDINKQRILQRIKK